MFKQFLTIIFSVFAFNYAAAQEISETLTLANKHFELKQYESAVKLYRRVAFFGNDSLKASVYPLIAKCYLYNSNYQESVFFFELSSNTTTSDSLFNEYAFSRALCHIFLGNFDYALQDVYTINESESLYFTRKYHFFLGVISLKKNEISQSQFHFLCASNSAEQYNNIINAYNEINPNKPDPKTARILSMFVPGLGQLYSGDAFNAANSFALSAALISLMVSVALKYTFIDGVLSVGPWFQRYYSGGYTKAERIAVNRQSEKRDELLSNLYLLFEKK